MSSSDLNQSRMTESAWTNVLPMAAGVYWFRDSTGVHLADVFQDLECLMVILTPRSRSSLVGFLLSTPTPLSLLKGEWAGPITPPR